MRVRYLNSSFKGFDGLSLEKKDKVSTIINDLLDFIEKKKKPKSGLGLRKLRKNIWEMRIDMKIRILFTLQQDLITFVLIRSHNRIKRYLKIKK